MSSAVSASAQDGAPDTPQPSSDPPAQQQTPAQSVSPTPSAGGAGAGGPSPRVSPAGTPNILRPPSIKYKLGGSLSTESRQVWGVFSTSV